jgi:hypothetical protein
MFIDLPWPWFFLGAVLAGGLVWLVTWIRSKGIKTTWYDWLISAVGIVFLSFALQNVWAAMVEFENAAILWFLVFFALPGIVLLVISWQLVTRRNRSA